jgi:hypothetical protein
MAAKVRRDKNGIYWVVVHHRGKRRHKRVGADRRTAEKVAREIQARLVLGDFDIRADRREASVPFGRFAANWLRREVELPIERGLEGHLAHGTARVYRLQVQHASIDVLRGPRRAYARQTRRATLLRPLH